MPIVTFITDNIEIEVPVGTTLIEAVNKSGASFPFACCMGSCGTCRCVVKEGIQNVNPRTEAENDLFENLTSVGAEERLGCQLTIQDDISVRY